MLRDFASTCASDTKNCSQTNLSVLLRRNINTSDTSHFRPLKLLKISLDAVYGADLNHTEQRLAAITLQLRQIFLTDAETLIYIP
jgi:hypothetical protein